MRLATLDLGGWPYGVFSACAFAFGAAATFSGPHRAASSQAAPAPPLVAAAKAAVPAPASGQHGAGKSGGGAFPDSAVYVDGKARGVLRYGELPPALEPVAMPQIDDLPIRRYYRITDYLKDIGVDVGAIREIHFYGSHDRIAVLTGEELRAAQDKMVFDFTQQVQGKPRARWSQLHALHHKPMVDVILSIAVYVEKPAPLYRDGQLWLDGKAVEDAIPYVGDSVPKGTRVYADGSLLGWVRRKALPNTLIAPGSEQTRAQFSTEAFLAWVGADTRRARAIEFYDGDALLARVDGASWALHESAYVFELPNRSHGQIKQLFPGGQSSPITSIRLYIHSAPPARQPDPDAFAHQGEGQNGGGNGDGSGGNNGDTPNAQEGATGPSSSDDDQL